MPDEKAYACLHVLSATRPVLYICRVDGDLVFNCGGRDHKQSADDWKVIHSGHLVDLDSTLVDVAVADGEQKESPMEWWGLRAGGEA